MKIIEVDSNSILGDLMTKVDTIFGHFQRINLQPRRSGQRELEVQDLEDAALRKFNVEVTHRKCKR